MSDPENAPVDATRIRAEAVIRAALAWRFRQGDDPVLTLDEYALYMACNEYGDEFKGVVSR